MFPMMAMGVLAGAGALFNAVDNIALGKEQEDRSADLKNQGDAVQKPELRPEFRDAERMREMAYLTGLPGMKNAKQTIGSEMAYQAAIGKQGATTGGDYLNYLNAIYGNSSKTFENLFAKDEAYRTDQLEGLAKTRWAIGEEEKMNEAIQRKKQDDLRAQANNLETAATQNTHEGVRGIFGSAMNMLGMGLGGAMGGTDMSEAQKSGHYKSVFDETGATDNQKSSVTDNQYYQPSADQTNGVGDFSVPGGGDKIAAVAGAGAPWLADNQQNFGGTAVDSDHADTANEILKSIGFTSDGGPDDIKKVQSYLAGSGFYKGNLDGVWGPKMKAAIQDYIDYMNNQTSPEDYSSYFYQSYVRPQ